MTMDLDRIKTEIKRTVESTISTIDPAFNIDEAIDTYFKVINYDLQIQPADDLSGLKNTKIQALNKALVEKDFSIDSISIIGLFNQDFESYVKKLYYSLEEFGEIQDEIRLDISKPHAFNPFMSRLNKMNPYFVDNEGNLTLNKFEGKLDNYNNPVYKKNNNGEIQYKKLYNNSLNLDEFINPDDPELATKYNNSFIFHFFRAYILRNKQSHSSPQFNLVQIVNNLNSTLISELWITDFLKEKLKIGMLKFHGKKMDFTEYIQREHSKLKQQSIKFVPLSLKLLKRVMDSSDQTNINDLLKKEFLRIRILGEGGSGKTTTLEYLVYKYCEDWLQEKSDKIPVLIYLGNLKENETIKLSIATKLSADISTIDELIEANSLVLFLDGVNEIVKSREVKKEILKEISSIINNNEALDIFITDRYELDTYQNDPFNIPTYSIQKLNEDQIERFVVNYSLNSGHSPEKILEVIKSKPKIKELLLKPILLSRAIEIIKIENTLPEKEGEIIERFIDLMLEREKNEKMDPLLKINEFKLLLGYAADQIKNELHTNSPINENKFLKILNEGAIFLGLEKHNAGFTMRIGFELEILSRKDNLLQFHHQLYFDFFVSHFFLNYHNV